MKTNTKTNTAPLVPLSAPVGVSGVTLPDSTVKDTPAETEDEHTGATAVNGDEWTGERDGEWWNYRAKDGSVYESREVPAYRIKMDNAKQVLVDGKLSIAPASPVDSVGVPPSPSVVPVEVPAVAGLPEGWTLTRFPSTVEIYDASGKLVHGHPVPYDAIPEADLKAQAIRFALDPCLRSSAKPSGHADNGFQFHYKR